MRKVIKISGKVLSAAAIVAIILPVALVLLLSVPGVQNLVVHGAARLLSRRLETTVHVGRIDASLFGRVRVENIYVEDLQHDTLLYADRVDAFVAGLGLSGGGIVLGRGEIDGAKLCLHETPEGEMNIKQLVDRLSRPDRSRKGNFRLTLRKAALRDMEFCLERAERRNPSFGIDFGHMHLMGLTARVDELTIDGQAISATFGALRARERSGFVLDHLSGRFYLNNGCIGFEDAQIVTARSNISIPYISLVGDSWAGFKNFAGDVRIEGELRKATVSTDDIAYFSPKLRDWHIDLGAIDLEATGTVADFTAKIRSMRIGRDTYLTADAAVRGLPDLAKTRFDVDLSRLGTTARGLDALARSIGRRELSDRLVNLLGNTGRIDLKVRFVGTPSDFDMRAGVVSGVGDVNCNLRVQPFRGELRSVRGDVATVDLRLGELLGRGDLLGNATLSAYINGVVGRGYSDANVTGRVSQLGFNGYLYDSLRFDGRLRNKEFDGRITARDPNLNFDFLGLMDFNDSVPRYDFSLDLHRADLAQLHINRRDSVSRLAARIVARGSGRSLDDMNGLIRVSDAVYEYNGKRIEAGRMDITGENSAASKFVELRSDFADATFRSKTGYRTIFEYLRRSARRYLPLVSRAGAEESVTEMQPAVADDYSLLSVSIRDFNPVADAVSPGLQVADGSTLRLLFNPANNRLSLQANSEYVERGRVLATHLSVNASNPGDSLALYASAEDFYADVFHLPHLSVTGGARKGRVSLSAGFTDTLRRLSGLVGLRAGVADGEGPGGRVVDLRILPSHITRGDKNWEIFARKILIDTARVVIDRFRIRNGGQELLVDGIASRDHEDSLTLTLHDFDLAPVSRIADRMGYEIEGFTNGRATMKSVMGGGQIAADIRVDSLAVNNIEGPPLRLTARWDFARNRAGIFVVNRTKRDTLVRGFYAPSQVRYYARMAVDSLDMGLLDPLLSGVITDTKGLASADLVLQGEHRNADLAGQIRVSDLSTKVVFTQVPYSVPRATLDVRGNRFRASNVPVFDPQGNRGRLDIDLNLQHLSNIAYDLRIAPQRMLVLNTTARDNDLFYGRVYATGAARITGDKGKVAMDIAATTDDNSAFYMPLSSNPNISYADFVTFVEPAEEEQDIVMRKKLSFERRRDRKVSAGSEMEIALALNVRPNVEVEIAVGDNPVKARGEGTLNLEIAPRSNVFEIYGDYTISEGSYTLTLQNVLTKPFIIENGSTIQWTGAPMGARLDIDAVYKLKTSLQPLLQGSSDRFTADRSTPVECVIHLGNRLTDPDVTFDVRVTTSDPESQMIVANALNTPETVDQQFLYLLLFNSFLAENNAAASSNIGASVGVGTGLEFLSNMLSNILSSSDYNVMIRYRPKSELTSDELDFGLSKSLIDNRLFVELEGNYLIDNKQAVNSSMSNFMGEAYITYLIDRAGTLRLKAFTQTIDRFDENQGLQETGIGIYFKEDFNNFRDLRRRIRERFTNRKRQERREARKAEAAKRKENGAGNGTEDGAGNGTGGKTSAGNGTDADNGTGNAAGNGTGGKTGAGDGAGNGKPGLGS